MSKRHNNYTEEFKQDAVRLMETSGKPKTQIARDLGISESALYRWLQTYGQATAAGLNGRTVNELEAELKRLRRENDVLRQERDVLKKAISIFSQSQR
jgi:transposase